MREKNETVWDWAILFLAALLLGLSVWMLTVEYPSLFRPGSLLNRPEMAVRQGLFGVLALALAFGVGRFLPLRQTLRLWWAPLPLFALLLVAIPITWWAGWAAMIRGTVWWQRSAGWIASMLVTIGGLMFALPRLAHPDKQTEPGGQVAAMAAFAGTLLFAAVWQIFSSFALLFVLLGIIGMSVFVVLNGWRRWGFMTVIFVFLGLTMMAFAVARPIMTSKLFMRAPDTYYQGYQAQMAIHAGGWTGCRAHSPEVPEWHTDFIFSRICNVGGLTAGILMLVLVGLLLTLAWRIVARQGRPATRALAAGSAAVLTVRSLLHIAINSGLWPLMPMPLPFLSYGPLFMLFDGVLLGMLMALDRGREELAPPQDRTTQRSSLQDGLADGTPAGQAPPRPETSCTMPRWPVTLIQVGIWTFLVLFVVRLHWLVSGEHSTRQYRARMLKHIEARGQELNKPLRGRILDVRGRVLAQPGERYYVCADPHFLADSPDRHLHADLLRMIGLDAEAFEQRTADTKRRYVRLATVPKTTAEAVKRMNLRGIFIDAQPSRDYPFETPLTHIAGFVNNEMVGASGIEQMKNAALNAGQDVRMAIDIELQAAVQTIAESANARAVQIVVMNPRTGAILAAAQVPATHGADSPKADPRARTWRSNMDVFEPGGLVQPLVVASAFELGTVATNTLINTENGSWAYHGIPMRDPHPFAEMSPADILIEGANIGMAKIGIEMGTNALHEAIASWGLNIPVATCIPGAESGTLHKPERWSKVDITRLPIGHGLACTLMQLARAYTAFFNDGRMVEPYLIEDFPRRDASALSAPVSGANAALVRDMLVRVVEEGTATAARIEGATVFGKTAVVHKPIAGGYDPDMVQLSFIGGMEREDAEPVLVAVWLDGLDRQASHAAAAIFRETALTFVKHAVK